MEHHFILRVVSKMLIPPIMLFALYVHFHADFGAGGGFQGGVIFAVAFILYGIVFGIDSLRLAMPPVVLRAVMALGVLIFAGTGVYSLLMGFNYLDYSALSKQGHPPYGQHLGIIIIEMGVLLAVAAAMIVIFMAFISRSPNIKDTDW